ncbi:MAG: WD40/YVTN/BNR-like repeat-containing protein [Nevskiales bacterium]
MKMHIGWMLLLALSACGGKDEEPKAADAVPPPEATAEAASDEAAPPPPHSIKPQPALEAPLAAKYRMIDIADTGQRLIAVGQRGSIVISDDGKTWKQVPSPVNTMLTRVRFLDAQRGWAVGYDGAILHTNDGGGSWALQHHNAEARQLFDILMLDAQNGIAVGGYGAYLATADGGANWQLRQFPIGDLGQHFNTIVQLGNGTLFIAGEKSLLATSTDRGENWQLLHSPYAGSMFGAVPMGERGVLVYGLRGRVYVAADIGAVATQDVAAFDPAARLTTGDAAGITQLGWQQLNGGLSESMFGAAKLPDGEVLLVGVNGLGEKTNLAAASLTPLKLPTDASLSGALARDGRVIGVGKRGVVDLGAIN